MFKGEKARGPDLATIVRCGAREAADVLALCRDRALEAEDAVDMAVEKAARSSSAALAYLNHHR